MVFQILISTILTSLISYPNVNVNKKWLCRKDPGKGENSSFFCLFVLFSVKLTLAMSLHDREPSSVRGRISLSRNRISGMAKEELNLRWEKLSVLEKQWTTQCFSRNLGKIQWCFYGEQEKVEYLINQDKKFDFLFSK